MHVVSDLVDVLGLWGLGLAMLVENLFPPIPSEAVLPLAGYGVAAGRFSLLTALVAATAGSVLGAVALYGFGRSAGAALLGRPRLLGFSQGDLARATGWFDRHGSALVFWGRLVPLVRSAISVPAGAAAMPVGRFVLLTAAGSLFWNAVLIGAGYLLGARWERVTQVAGAYSSVVLVVGAVAALAAAAWQVRRRITTRRAARQG